MTIQVYTSLNPSDCMVGGCRNAGPLKMLCKTGEFRMCATHYQRLLERVRAVEMDDEHVGQLTPDELSALLEGDEFRQLIAKLVSDERFREIIRKRVKRRKQ